MLPKHKVKFFLIFKDKKRLKFQNYFHLIWSSQKMFKSCLIDFDITKQNTGMN